MECQRVVPHVQYWTIFLILPNFLLVKAGSADDWPHWRGLQRDGKTNESSGYRGTTWPPDHSSWDVNVGAGGSSPIVVGNRVFTLGWIEGADRVSCLDADTGREIWHQSYRCPSYGRHSDGDKGLYSGPSSCPAYDSETGSLFTLSTDGDLNCWDTSNDGRSVWSLNLYDKYNVPQRPKVGSRRLRDYGYTTAPLIYGDWVIVEVGAEDGNLMAFSKHSGKRQWTSQSTDPAGHTGGIVPMLVEGLPCVAVLTIRHLLVARLDRDHEGQTVAEFPWETDFANNVATPAVLNNSVVITSEYNQYAIARIDVTRSGARQVWSQPFASGVCSPVISNGCVYWCWRGVYCLDFESGAPIWRGGRFGDTASMIATADDRLIIWAQRGDLVLAETFQRSPEKYTELARRNDIFETDVWPHIAISNGRLYCRDRAGHLQCLVLSP